MRSTTRLAASLNSTLRQTANGSARQAFVCHSCKARVRIQPTTPRLPAQQSRKIATTASRRVGSTAVAHEKPEGYKPAPDWEGLEWIGSKEWLSARDARPVAHNRYGGRGITAESPKQALRIGLRRAIIESLALDTAGITPERRAEILESTKSKPMSSDDIGIRISPHTRAAELVYKNASVQTRLDTHFGIQSVQSSNDEERALTDAELSGWKDLPLLADLKKKFAIVKRVASLTGITLPDATISNKSTAGQVLAKLERQPESKSVLQALAADKRLDGLDNVTIFGRRQSYVDKDRAKGRWKVIEQELQDRGLPLPKGRAWMRALRERRAPRRDEQDLVQEGSQT